MKISQRLILGFLVVALVPLLIVSVIGINQQANIIAKLSIVDAKDIAKTIEESISLVPETSPIYLISEDLQEFLSDFIEKGKDFVVVDANKRILADAVTENIGTEFTHDTENEVGLAIQTDTPQTFIEKSPDYPKGINLVAVPMKSEEGEIVGAVLLEYEEGELKTAQGSAEAFAIAITHKPSSIPLYSEQGKLQSYVEDLSVDMRRDIVVIDLNKIIIADTVPENIGAEFTHDVGDEIRQTMRDHKPRIFREISPDYPEGIPLVAVPLTKEKEGVEEGEEEIIGAVVTSFRPLTLTGFKYTLLLTALFAILVVIISGLLLARSISSPIIKLKDITAEIGKGKLDTKVEIKSRDEIGQLAASFNKMTEDLRRSRDVLMQSQQKYKTLVDSINGIVWELDARTFQFSFVSKQAERLLGYPVEHWLTEPTFWKDHIHPDDREGAVAFRKKVTAENRTYEFEYRMIAADGHTLWLRDIVTAVVENDQPVNLRGVMVDITKRKETERRLIKLNECFLSFGTDTIENINSLTALCGELLGATCALYNRLEEGMLCSWGKWNTPAEYNPVDKPKGHICYDVIQRGGDDIFVIRNLSETSYAQTDPNVIPYKLQTYVGKAVKFAGTFVGSLCVVYQRDFVPEEADKKLMEIIASAIAVEEVRKMADEALKRAYKELKESQLQLVRAEKLAVVGQLAAGVAHEINNPLNVISGNAEMLSKESQDQEVKRATKVIMEQVKRAAGITERLLQFSRKIKPKIGRVDINKVMEDTLYLSGYQTKYQNIRIIKRLDLSLPEVMADFGQLQEVLLNIILNAVQAMPNGGELTIKTYTKEIGKFGRRKTDMFKQGSEVVIIEFRDTGEGIPEEKLKKIFDPFFSTKENGTGLGLSICHGIIEAHQGTIEAQSTVGKGTTFIIQLPAQKEKGVQNG